MKNRLLRAGFDGFADSFRLVFALAAAVAAVVAAFVSHESLQRRADENRVNQDSRIA